MVDITVEQALQMAVEHHRAGRFGEAESIYRQIVAFDPNCAEAWHLLGMLATLAGRLDAAAELRAKEAEAHLNLGNTLRYAGRLDEAILRYQRSVESGPDNPQAFLNVATTLRDAGRASEAIPYARHLLELRPDSAEAHGTLGLILQDAGQFMEAMTECRRAIEIQPDNAVAHVNLGAALRVAGQLDLAIHHFQRAIDLGLSVAELHYNLGNAWADKLEPQRAAQQFRRAVELKPDFLEAWINLSAVLRSFDPLESAVRARRVLEMQPNEPDSHLNLGVALQEQLLFDEALKCYDRALQLDPNHGKTHWNRGLVLLMLGDYERGWDEYAWRLRVAALSPRQFAQPIWDGSDPSGKTVLIHTEQGYGDVIQCSRYIPLLAGRGARVLLECRKELVRLVSRLPGVAQVLTLGDKLPSFDLHVPAMGLPGAFHTTLQTIPATVPYLEPDPDLVRHWAERIEDVPGLKVGLVWSGNKLPYARRTCGLAPLAPLAEVSGVSFFSLQIGEGVDEAKSPPVGLNLIDYTNELHDFADTAALVLNLDLVITIDSAMAHLGGALGKPTWVMLSYAGDWRWLLDREDSPWYPTMRLFRQKAPGDWASVARQVRAALEEHVTKNSTQN